MRSIELFGTEVAPRCARSSDWASSAALHGAGDREGGLRAAVVRYFFRIVTNFAASPCFHAVMAEPISLMSTTTA